MSDSTEEPTKMTAETPGAPTQGVSDRDKISMIPLNQLQLDTENPRFAGILGQSPSQQKMVDHIADAVGIDDLLSSMSKSGFFHSAPLVGIRSAGDKVLVVEGNRRLAAALVLKRDERAKNQEKRASAYSLSDSVAAKLTELPVLIEDGRDAVLPYLGVSHIIGNKTWDSFAKAAWAASVLDKRVYPGGIDEICELIGDKNRTLPRMVEGYRLTTQLIDHGLFDPKDATQVGRGASVPFAFSWVYTAMGYLPVRKWLGIAKARSADASPEDRPEESETSSELDKEIVPETHLKAAGEFMGWLLGQKSKGVQSVISDSRQIGDLAAALDDASQIKQLRAGKTVEEAQELTRPVYDRIATALTVAVNRLESVAGIVASSSSDLVPQQIEDLLPDAKRAIASARNTREMLEDELKRRSE